MDGDKITDIGLDYISKLKYLNTLEIEESDVTFEGIEGFNNLNELKIIHCSPTNQGLDCISKIPNLYYLEILEYGYGFTFEDIEGFQKLKTLDLHTCESITKKGIIQISKIPLLNRLSLVYSGCHHIGDDEMRRIAEIPNLEYFDITCYDSDTGEGDINRILTFEDVNGFGKLKKLTLGGFEKISTKGFACITKYSNLQELSITDCCGNNPLTFENAVGLKTLKNLYFSRTRVNNDIFKWMSMCSDLEYIKFYQMNTLKDILAGYLSKLTKLQKIELIECEEITQDAVKNYINFITFNKRNTTVIFSPKIL